MMPARLQRSDLIARWRQFSARRRAMTATERRKRVILTAEGLRLPLTLATRATRAAALMIDLGMIFGTIVITTLVILLFAHVLGADRIEAQDKSAAGDLIQILAVVWIIALFLARSGWFLWFELGSRGATPGKRMTGIRIAARPGANGVATRLTAEAVIARNLLRDIELFMPLIFIGGAISAAVNASLAGWASLVWFGIFAGFPFFNRDGLRCGDVIAGTWVVETPRSTLRAALSVGASAQGTSTLTGVQYRFSDEELAIYGEYELQVLERVLRDNRDDALAEVAMAICRKIGWTSGAGDERAFLRAYYTQLRARLEAGMRFGNRKADKHAK